MNLFDKIISLQNLLKAFFEFRKGKRNKPEILRFERNLEENLFKLYQILKKGKYQHDAYTHFHIYNPKFREVYKAKVEDRIVHQAVYQILNPIFEKIFIFDSYSSRKKKGKHKAFLRLESFMRKKSKNWRKGCFVLKADIRKYFENIDHCILKELIKRRIKDKKIFFLVSKVIDSFESTLGKGMPLGNITSQLFANIYLHELDFYLKENLRLKYYLRYCDDFVIVENRDNFKSLAEKISAFLKKNLKLELHGQKIIIRKPRQGIDFLGYVSFPYFRLLRSKTKRRILCNLQEKSIILKKGEIPKIKFDQTTSSYFGLLKHCHSFKLREKIINF